jgi:hypothetical protein
MRKQFEFSATAVWVTDGIESQLPEEVPLITVTTKRNKPPRSCSGTLTVSAPTQTVLDEAIKYVEHHSLYKDHFKPKGS